MMPMTAVKPYQQEVVFFDLVEAVANSLNGAQHFSLALKAEDSQFSRFSKARVRQTGTVKDGSLTLVLMTSDRSGFSTVPFTGDFELDWPMLKMALVELQSELPLLPVDPYVVLPQGKAQSHEVFRGELLSPVAIANTLLPPVQAIDFTGIYAGGLSIRAYGDSAGQRHWFETTAYTLDYSLFDGQGQAVKGTVAGSQWDASSYLDKIAATQAQLALMGRPTKSISRGQYRTYLAPAAMNEIIYMFSWGGFSEADLQQGNSALGALRRGEKRFSPKFSLIENFGPGQVPRFNSLGEVAPLELSIIDQGCLANSLVSSRSAKEYKLSTNFAAIDESLRAPEILPGTLLADDILQQLDTGLYLSNLHYLNWSDHPNGRITGMTRYACFWVEQGEIVAPIQDLRFDDSLYQFFGPNLIDLTQFQEFIPNVETYDHRSIGGVLTPGALIEDFTYTL